MLTLQVQRARSCGSYLDQLPPSLVESCSVCISLQLASLFPCSESVKEMSDITYSINGISLSNLLLKTLGFLLLLHAMIFLLRCSKEHLLSQCLEDILIRHVLACSHSLNWCHWVVMVANLVDLDHPFENFIQSTSSFLYIKRIKIKSQKLTFWFCWLAA